MPVSLYQRKNSLFHYDFSDFLIFQFPYNVNVNAAFMNSRHAQNPKRRLFVSAHEG
jgi:hypothetical protein